MTSCLDGQAMQLIVAELTLSVTPGEANARHRVTHVSNDAKKVPVGR
jgi:hypothetical protein